MSADAEPDASSLKTQLLADIRVAFATAQANRMTSAGMIAELIEDTTGRWAEFGRTGKPLTPKKLAGLLDQFGIKAKNMRVSCVAGVAKGSERRAFEDTFDRYLSHTPQLQSATSEQVSDINGLAAKRSATSDFHVSGSKWP